MIQNSLPGLAEMILVHGAVGSELGRGDTQI